MLQGGKDVQVPATANLQRIREALGNVAQQNNVSLQDDNHKVKVLLLPELNHLLKQAKTGGIHEYLLLEQTIAPLALDHISSWMQQLTKTSPKRH